MTKLNPSVLAVNDGQAEHEMQDRNKLNTTVSVGDGQAEHKMQSMNELNSTVVAKDDGQAEHSLQRETKLNRDEDMSEMNQMAGVQIRLDEQCLANKMSEPNYMGQRRDVYKPKRLS
jgi:hypothetical protein